MTGNEQVFHINTRPTSREDKEIVLSELAHQRAREIVKLYPKSRSAVMPLLYIAQEECGYITQQAVDWVAGQLDLPPMQVWEVATFYTMYYKKPVGKYHVQVCRTLPCALRGAKHIGEYVYKKLGIRPGEVSKDGLWSFEEVECLGSCGTAPMCQINDVYFANLTEEKLDGIFSRIENELPDLRLSTLRDELGRGLEDHPRSEIVGTK